MKILKEQIEKKEKQLERKKTKYNSGVDFWQMLGLKVTVLDSDKKPNDGQTIKSNGQFTSSSGSIVEGNLAFEFSKIDPKNLSRSFSVKVNISKDGVKIYETDPKDLFMVSDLDRIERTAATDPRLLILLIRSHIISKFKLSSSELSSAASN